jgi:hypothetical protein
VLSFSLAHNSAYLAGRDIIADRPIDITRSSPTSTAVLEFGFKAKVAMATVGIIALIIRAIVEHFRFTY